MIDFEHIRKQFEQQAIDILRYEFYYYDVPTVRKHFKQRMKKYISMNWSLSKPKIKFFEDENIIGYRVQFTAESTGEIHFGFQYCADLGLFQGIRSIID